MALRTLIFIILSNLFISADQPPKGDAIIGKWISDKGNLQLQVYKKENQYRAKVIFHSGKTEGEVWRDEKNPDPALRSRTLLGKDLLTQMRYDPDNNDWEDGIIYDPSSGKSFEAIVKLVNPNTLKIKGYWLIKTFSKTKIFKRM